MCRLGYFERSEDLGKHFTRKCGFSLVLFATETGTQRRGWNFMFKVLHDNIDLLFQYNSIVSFVNY